MVVLDSMGDSMKLPEEDQTRWDITRSFELSKEFLDWSRKDDGNGQPSLELYGFKTPWCKFRMMQSSLYHVDMER